MDKCDTITVLRDGILTADLKKEEFEADKIRSLMIGRKISEHYYREDIDKKVFVFNPEENEYPYYGG